MTGTVNDELGFVDVFTEAVMWKKPKIVEISVGMEINCYACAEIA